MPSPLILNSTNVEVVKQVDLDLLETLYQRLQEDSIAKRVLKLDYCDWPLRLQYLVRKLVGDVTYYNSSWFTREMPSGVRVAHWHVDEHKGQKDRDFLLLAYPTPTEFLINGEIFRPQVGELVRVKLCQVKHRTPSDGLNKPRLLIRDLDFVASEQQ